MMEKKKLLVVMQHLRRGGVELAAINFASNLNKDKYSITYYLVDVQNYHDEALESELLTSGAKIIKVLHRDHGYIKGYFHAKKIISSGKYDIVHSHVMFFSGIIAAAAKHCGVKKIVTHSHGTKWNHKENVIFKVYKAVMRKLINKNATHILACSEAAGEYLYGKKEYQKRGIFVPNGIDCSAYAYNEAVRREVRNEFGIGNGEILIGHIGTIYKIKNQVFLVEIFAEMLKTAPDSHLLLAGERVEDEPVLRKAKELGIENKIIFTGQRSDVSRLLQGFDIMIFPSLYEGLPVSLIEAQAAKLPCLISTAVTNEVAFNKNTAFMPLSEPAAKWGEKAFELIKANRNETDITSLVNNFDIHKATEILNKIYLD